MKPTKKVVIIDDHAEKVDLAVRHLTLQLEKAQYEVLHLSDRTRALETCRCVRPGVVILDLVLPEIDGSILCKDLRSLPETRDAFILVLHPGQVLGWDIGADDYIGRRPSPRELVQTVTRVLETGKAAWIE